MRTHRVHPAVRLRAIVRNATLAVLLVVLSVGLFAARIAVKAFKSHAATTPGDADDKAAVVAEGLVDAASAAVEAARVRKGARK